MNMYIRAWVITQSIPTRHRRQKQQKEEQAQGGRSISIVSKQTGLLHNTYICKREGETMRARV